MRKLHLPMNNSNSDCIDLFILKSQCRTLARLYTFVKKPCTDTRRSCHATINRTNTCHTQCWQSKCDTRCHIYALAIWESSCISNVVPTCRNTHTREVTEPSSIGSSRACVATSRQSRMRDDCPSRRRQRDSRNVGFDYQRTGSQLLPPPKSKF